MVFEQTAKLQQRRGAGRRPAREVDVVNPAHRLAVVDRVFQRFFGQAEPLLREVHDKNQRRALGREAQAPTREVQRFDQGFEPCPRDHPLHWDTGRSSRAR